MPDKAPPKRTAKPVDPAAKLAAVLEKIDAMPAPFNEMGRRLHVLITAAVPILQPDTWYGMPAYTKNGKTLCFFRADKDYMTFGITLDANLTRDEDAPDQLIGSAWYFAALDAPTEARLSAIVRRIAS